MYTRRAVRWPEVSYDDEEEDTCVWHMTSNGLLVYIIAHVFAMVFAMPSSAYNSI
jgi:hypothetical protein